MMDLTSTKSSPPWSARQVILGTLLIAAVILGFWLLWRFHMTLVILFAAIILGTALNPLADWLTAHRWSRAAAMLLIFGGIILILVGVFFLIIPSLARQSVELMSSIPALYDQFRQMLLQSQSIFLWNVGLRMPQELSLWLSKMPQNAEPLNAVADFIRISDTLLGGVLAVGAVFLLTAFWILGGERTQRSLLLLAPAAKRDSLKELWELIENRLAAFVRGQSILMLSIGLMALVAYWLIGLPHILVLALIAGIMEAVPIVGPALGALPAMAIAYTVDPILAVWVIVSTIIIQTAENYLLVPRVMGAAVGVNPIITLLLLAALGSLLGLPGALLAIPSAAVMQVLVDRFILSKNSTSPPALEGRSRTSLVRYEVQELIGDVRKQLRKKEGRSSDGSDEIEDAIESLAVELDHLLMPGNGETLP